MKIFLTGGTGFIGSHVAMELLKHGHTLTILARNRNKVPALHSVGRIEVVEGDLNNFDLIQTHLDGKDACIHIALKYTTKTACEVLMDDTLPTVKMSDMAVAAGVRHFIYTSSTAVNDSLYAGGTDQVTVPDNRVTARTKQLPATFYGATKAAAENYLVAQSFLSSMRVNIIRPGYTFGNPVIEGASIQSDRRFRDIVDAAMENRPITVIKNDGTQFIWAGDLAKLYVEVLHGRFNRRTYFGLSGNFTSWRAIAEQAVEMTGSRSEIQVEDRGWEENGLVWDVSDMQKDFGLEFDAWDKIVEHLEYYIEGHRQNIR
jgi:UDP-glucose 4-epimerase